MRGNRHYVQLAIMTALSFISMYVLMYAMVNRFANVYSNLNQFYMAGLMTAPIVVIELALMRAVYDNKNQHRHYCSQRCRSGCLFPRDSATGRHWR
jgi:hypothetical protein